MSMRPSVRDAGLSRRPLSELRAYAASLGVAEPASADRTELERRLATRLDTIRGLERGALLDLAAWSGIAIEGNPPNVRLAQGILGRQFNSFDGCSLRGMRVLARLRELGIGDNVSRDELEQQLRTPESLWDAVRRTRRRMLGSLVGRALRPAIASAKTDGTGRTTARSEEDIRERIEGEGLVGGLTTTLRGVADDYVAEKLDEIERRVDAKLDEIDRRLSDWRDREVANRLRILKITLVASILVAVVSLGYDYMRARVDRGPQDALPAQVADH